MSITRGQSLILTVSLLAGACANISVFDDQQATDNITGPTSTDNDTQTQPIDSVSETSSGSSDTGTGTATASATEATSESASESAQETDSPSATVSSCDATMSEAFDGSAIPSGWTVEDGDSDGYTWEWKETGNDIGGEASGGYLVVDASTAVGAAFNERLVSLELESSGCSELSVSFDQSFPKGSNDHAYVEVSVNGAAWQSVEHYDAAATGRQNIDLSAVLSLDASFRVGFRYEGSNGQYWKLDNVRILTALE